MRTNYNRDNESLILSKVIVIDKCFSKHFFLNICCQLIHDQRVYPLAYTVDCLQSPMSIFLCGCCDKHTRLCCATYIIHIFTLNTLLVGWSCCFTSLIWTGQEQNVHFRLSVFLKILG